MTTKIEWVKSADGTQGHTWNPVRGCTPISEGCAHCYAARMASRFAGPGGPYEGLARGGKWTGQVRFVPEMLEKPLHWRKPRVVFVNSMGDLFHEQVTDEQIAAVFGVMAACPQHTFQILTKQIGRALEWFNLARKNDPTGFLHVELCNAMQNAGDWDPDDSICEELCDNASEWPLPNVWLGCSCENQEAANERIPLLLQTPAARRFVSLEPLLGPVDLSIWLYRGVVEAQPGDPDYDALNWVIVGSESGPRARPMDLDWVRSIRDQCVEAGVPFFLKQVLVRDFLGKIHKVSLPELDGRSWRQVPEVTP